MDETSLLITSPLIEAEQIFPSLSHGRSALFPFGTFDVVTILFLARSCFRALPIEMIRFGWIFMQSNAVVQLRQSLIVVCRTPTDLRL
jgi:hypothetical protein